jgi:hypothetical protein
MDEPDHPLAPDPSPASPATDRAAPDLATMHAYAEQIGRVAAWSPHRSAVDGPSDRRTFAELHARSCQLANALLVKFTPTGGTIGVHAATGPETIEVVVATALIGARTVAFDPALDAEAFEARCRQERVVGLVVEHTVVGTTTAAIGRLEELNFAFVLDAGAGARPDGPMTLPGAAPYEPTLAAYPASAPEPDGPRLRRVRPHVPPALLLPEPPPEVVLGPGAVMDDIAAVLGCLAMGGRILLPDDGAPAGDGPADDVTAGDVPADGTASDRTSTDRTSTDRTSTDD